MSVDSHAQAYRTLLTAAGLTVHDGKVPDAAPLPYVVLHTVVAHPPADQSPDSSNLDFASNGVWARCYLHSVGGNAQAAREVANRVSVALLDVTPTVAGRSCGPIRWEDGQPPQRDETTGVLVMDLVDVYRFLSVPG